MGKLLLWGHFLIWKRKIKHSNSWDHPTVPSTGLWPVVRGGFTVRRTHPELQSPSLVWLLWVPVVMGQRRAGGTLYNILGREEKPGGLEACLLKHLWGIVWRSFRGQPWIFLIPEIWSLNKDSLSYLICVHIFFTSFPKEDSQIV